MSGKNPAPFGASLTYLPKKKPLQIWKEKRKRRTCGMILKKLKS